IIKHLNKYKLVYIFFGVSAFITTSLFFSLVELPSPKKDDSKSLDTPGYESYISNRLSKPRYALEFIEAYAFKENYVESNYQQELSLNPTKEDLGLKFDKYSGTNQIEVLRFIFTKLEKKDLTKLKEELLNFLKEDSIHFGIYLFDLKRGQLLEINSEKIFPPASISKLPSVLLTLKDIDSKKYSFETPVVVKDELKHTNWDTIGQYKEGTKIPLKTFIDAAILESNNSAHYHLHDLLGGLSIVNKRTQIELGAETFFLDPHQATAYSIATVLINLYNGNLLSAELTDYMINLMETTGADLRMAIPASVPANAKVANKVGFLFGGNEGSTYSDAAIVFGEKTDYVLVVLNDSAPDYPYGYIKIKDISEKIYNYLN
ncbi:serine hydrolase, partial [Candidatus Dojkabacteria bacterium]|nr:serine hydrolase [Candidatus Dojkabacteria bacterium]